MSTSGRSKITTEALPVNDRTEQLRAAFTEVFKCAPAFYVRVPGRVNLIGEHIDYSGYGVCPMALQQDILLAVAIDNEGTLRLANLDPGFRQYDCAVKDLAIDLTDGAPQWYQYFLCGVKGICEIIPKEAVSLRGLKVLVSGTIPQSAGLSSSSALVCAAALATAYAHGIDLDREEIADICAKCERYIGTQGGGMDQAIAFLATKGCAKLINFEPLRSEDVRLPPGAVFVIAHSLIQLNKAATADYNWRVVECRLAAQVLAKKSGLEWRNIKKLGELQSALNMDLDQLITLVRQHLHIDSYTRDELLMELATTASELESVSLTSNTKHLKVFKLHQRALHVYQEALRVQQFHEVCKTNADGGGGEEVLELLGNLMSASHESLRDLYECSHPELDRLVEMSKGVACGTRLTGAGWGGCVVALTTREHVEDYLTMLRAKFYTGNVRLAAAATGGGGDVPLPSILFTTEPQSGATIYHE